MAFSPEDLLLWGGLAAAAATVLAAFFHLRGQGYDHYMRAQRLALVSAAFYASAFAVLVYDFVFQRLHVDYVWRHTQGGTPLPYRIAAAWGGNEGTLLLWTLFAAAALALNARAWQRRIDRGLAAPPDGAHPLPWVLPLGFLVVAAFGVLILLHSPFARTDPVALALQPGGRGLQPVLKTPFMVIHPPLQFLAYGLSVLLFAAGLAHLVTRRPEWADIALPWARATLLASWTGLGLGALWAYYVLNFGGYWAWDPVETANLLTFLPLIPLVHGLIYYRKRRMFAVMAPLFALLSFVATLFSTLTTRTGLWVSVHAFTDPSQNFVRDPLRRLLEILDAEPLARELTALLLVVVAGTVAAYLWSVQTDRRATGPPPGRAALAAGLAALFFAGAAATLALLDPRLVVALLFEAGHRLWPSNAPAGLGLVALGAIVVLSVPAWFGPEAPAPPRGRGLERWMVMANLVFLGMLFVCLGLLAVFLIDVLTINGYTRAHYDRRAPFLILPVLLTLAVALSNKFIGTRRSLLLAAAALVLGAVLAGAGREPWEILLVAPALLFALYATCLKLFKVSDPGADAPRRLRVAGLVLLLGGVATLAYWANPPTRIPLGFTVWRASAWNAAWGCALGLLALAGAVSTLRRRNYRLAILGAIALAGSLAWSVAPLLGAFAGLLVRRHRADFREGLETWDLAATFGATRREFRKTGTYLIHVALVLGVAGYGASTYLEGAETEIELHAGEVERAHGYEFRLVGSDTRGVEPETQLARDVRALVLVSRDQSIVGVVPLTMWLELPAHYAEHVAVERLAFEDLYLRPFQFTTDGPGGRMTFVAHDDGVQLRPGTQVEKVVFTAKTLPGMHLVWSGVLLISTGLTMVLAFGGAQLETQPRVGRD